MKSVVAILMGLFAGVIVIYLIESISHQIYPMPNGLKIENKQALEEWMNTLPAGANFLVLVAWLLGSTVGGFVASYMDRANAKTSTIGVGIFLLIATLMNLYLIPHPAWMWIGGIIAIFIGVWLGYKFRGQQSLRSH